MSTVDGVFDQRSIVFFPHCGDGVWYIYIYNRKNFRRGRPHSCGRRVLLPSRSNLTIRAAQCLQNVFLRALARNRQKKIPGRPRSEPFFDKNCYCLIFIKNCPNRGLPGVFVRRFLAGTLENTFWTHLCARIVVIRSGMWKMATYARMRTSSQERERERKVVGVKEWRSEVEFTRKKKSKVDPLEGSCHFLRK